MDVAGRSGALRFVATGDSHLWALDAWTGRPVGDFGMKRTRWENNELFLRTIEV